MASTRAGHLAIADPLDDPAMAPGAERIAPRRSDERARERAEARNRLVVVDKPRRRVGLVTGLVVVSVFGTMLGLTAFQIKLAHDQMRLDHLETQVRTEQATFDKLRAIVADLQAPDRIVAEAESYGMVRPDKIVYVAPDAATVAAVAKAGLATPDPNAKPADGAATWKQIKRVAEGAP